MADTSQGNNQQTLNLTKTLKFMLGTSGYKEFKELSLSYQHGQTSVHNYYATAMHRLNGNAPILLQLVSLMPDPKLKEEVEAYHVQHQNRFQAWEDEQSRSQKSNSERPTKDQLRREREKSGGKRQKPVGKIVAEMRRQQEQETGGGGLGWGVKAQDGEGEQSHHHGGANKDSFAQQPTSEELPFFTSPRPFKVSNEKTRRAVVWFRGDLRVQDHSPLLEAAGLVARGDVDKVTPVYCLDPRHFKTTPRGNPKTGKFRAKFLLESLQDLQANLRELGSDLLVLSGRPEDVLSQLLEPGGGTLLAHKEICDEEVTVEEGVEAALAKLPEETRPNIHYFPGATLYRNEDLPYDRNLRDLPDVFTPHRNKAEKRCKILPPQGVPKKGSLPWDASGLPGTAESSSGSSSVPPLPTLKDLGLDDEPLHPNAVLHFKGGESAALERLKYYVWDSDLVANYFNIRNGMVGGDYSTKLAPWLAHGCITPRTVREEIRKYELQRTENKSTYWVSFELLWRDYARLACEKHGNAIFQLQGPSPPSNMPRWSKDQRLFKRWRDGKTGYPLVDANMRELKQTGFMSNRGRQNVASFLAHDLKLDWRMGADWFESVLIDYDVHTNWYSWVAAAGMTGGRINKFNILKQSKDYDSDGAYVKLWCPELKLVPVSKVHAPWKMTREEQEASSCMIGRDYPSPVVQIRTFNN